MAEHEREQETDPGRRTFLGVATACVGACFGAGALGLAGVVLGSPISGGIVEIEGGGADLGPLEQFPLDVPVKVVVRGRTREAFLRANERVLGGAIVVRTRDGLRVFASTCPHAGCDVEPAADKRSIRCPCHDSRFALSGARETGPSPRALDALAATVEKGRVLVKFARFRTGISEKRPV